MVSYINKACCLKATTKMTQIVDCQCVGHKLIQVLKGVCFYVSNYWNATLCISVVHKHCAILTLKQFNSGIGRFIITTDLECMDITSYLMEF